VTEAETEIFERWLPDYRGRAEAVSAALSELFQQAMKHWVSDDSGKKLIVSKSREFLKAKRAELPYRILFFIYSSQFDEDVEARILDSEESRAGLSGDLTPQEILARKASLLESNFKALTLGADALAGCYTVALSANESLRELPLVWEVPAEDETKTGFPSDYMWQMTFRFLCEVAHAIVAYGGYSAAFFDELAYIRNEPDLAKRLLWLDQDRRLFFPDRDEETWPLTEIGEVLQKLENQQDDQ
jgi:hypothetical protein